MDIQSLIDQYTLWLKSEISFDRVGEYYEITTPYLDNANDYLQIYVRLQGDEVYFTDDSATIQRLRMGGLQFSQNRKLHLQRILNQFGIQLNKDELIAKAPIGSFAQKKHAFIQAMLRIDDMFALSKTKVASLFLDDIQEYFTEHEIYYTDNVQFTGTSGFSHNYDFVMQRSKTKPERLCQAVNLPNKTSMSNILFAWNDTKPSRKSDSQLIVLINDQQNISKGVIDGFTNYDAKVIRWSERKKPENLALLTA